MCLFRRTCIQQSDIQEQKRLINELFAWELRQKLKLGGMILLAVVVAIIFLGVVFYL